MLNVLRDIFFVCCCCSIVYYILATAAGLVFSRRAKRVQRPNGASDPPDLLSEWPSVVLVKPLHGYDEDLACNLQSFMELDYPKKEYLFGITAEDDPALRALDEIRQAHPTAKITLTVGDEASTNRKVGKLLRMLRQPPKSEILVMSDADVRVDRDYLRRIVGELESDKKIGMVTCVYKGVAPGGSLGARLEANFINTDFAPTAILSHVLEPMRHAFASTVAVRQSTLRQVGGLDAVKNSFGDDFALARRVTSAGYEIRLSSSIVTMVTERMPFRDFWDHQMRWAMVDRKIRPISQARMLINGPFWALALFLASGFAWPWIAMALVTVAARLGMTALTLRQVLRLPVRFLDLLLTPLKDFLMQVIWIRSLVGNTVEWSGRKLRLLPTGEMEEVT
ncbi:MAG: glycosyltransferase [Terriglobia bacterium]